MAQLLEFATNHPFLVSSLVALLVLVIANELRIRAGGTDVTPAEAVSLINDGATVIDVRSATQFSQGHVLNARNVPLSDLNGGDGIKKLRDKTLITCCDTGSAGARAATSLRQQGFGRVVNLRGGLTAWRGESLPVSRDKKARDKKDRGKSNG